MEQTIENNMQSAAFSDDKDALSAVESIRIKDYDYDLPDERIAKFPLKERDHSKLLIYKAGTITEDHFFNLPSYLPKGSLMVFNNTRVIQARLHFRKPTGALIEVFLLEPAVPADYEQMFQTTDHCSWFCLIGNLKKWKDGALEREIDVNGQKITLRAQRNESAEGLSLLHTMPNASHRVDFFWDGNNVSFAELLDAVGELPIPPYLNRETEESDKRTYQTVYSKIKGSVAAPTAGLHFTENVLSALDNHGIIREEVTLHVGAGTFRPVKSEAIEGHEMHTEYFCVRRQTLAKLLEHQCKAIAVGTTSVRTLESLYYIGVRILRNPDIEDSALHVEQWEPYQYDSAVPRSQQPTVSDALQAVISYLDRNHLAALHASTQIIIAPGYEYKIVKTLVTNFHQPQSTLLLLVSAFVKGDWRTIYDYALAHDFRFLSYGDSCLIMPESAEKSE